VKKKKWMMEATWFCAPYIYHKEIMLDSWSKKRWFDFLEFCYECEFGKKKPEEFAKLMNKQVTP
jgi:hypothetical protein